MILFTNLKRKIKLSLNHLKKKTMKDKKILIIGQFPPPYNGTSIALKYLFESEYLTRRFKLFKINTSRKVIRRDVDIGKLSLEKVFQDLNSFIKLFLLFLLKNPGLVYITIAQTKLGYLRDGFFIFFSKIFGKKCVVHLHGGYFKFLYENSSFWFKWYVKKTVSKADVVVVLSESLRRIFKNLVEEKKIRVVENCVDEEFFMDEKEIEEKLKKINSRKIKKNLPFNVLFLGNFLKTKGYWDVLEAAVIIKDKGLPISFIFAGTWPNEEEKKQALAFVNEKGLNKCTNFMGFISGNEKRKILIDSDLFVLPTYYPYEGVPISILEAMASGLPIITTKWGGIPDVVNEGINGFFVKPKDSFEIASYIIKLFKNPDLQLEIAKANIEKAKKRFKKINYEKSLTEIFEEVLE